MIEIAMRENNGLFVGSTQDIHTYYSTNAYSEEGTAAPDDERSRSSDEILTQLTADLSWDIWDGGSDSGTNGFTNSTLSWDPDLDIPPFLPSSDNDDITEHILTASDCSTHAGLPPGGSNAWHGSP